MDMIMEMSMINISGMTKARFLGAYYTKEEGLKALEKYKKIKGFCSHFGWILARKASLDKIMLDGKMVMLLIIKKMR